MLTKIICTLGPATSSDERLDAIVAAGLDVARVNMAHGTRDQQRGLIRGVRRAAERAGRPVGVLVDLPGPKLRVGDLDEPVVLEEGATLVLAPEEAAIGGEIPTTFPALADSLSAGDRVLMDDGLLECRVTSTDGDRATTTVVRGGLLKGNKGINLPDVHVQAPSLTARDLEDLEFALAERVEFIGLSFVRRPEDVEDLKRRVDGRSLVVAKIERARAMGALTRILEVTDAVMVARGDLGVELPFEQVPLAQKRIIQMANYHGRPVITATQMLESMIKAPRPTRAEASDAANAVLDGTDALMLSAETAVGDYPVEAVEALVRIATEIEEAGVLGDGPRYYLPDSPRSRAGATDREHAVARATLHAVEQLEAPAVLVITRSGFTARLVSSYRPSVPIFGVCTDQLTFRELTMVWGVIPVLANDAELNYESLLDIGRARILDAGLGAPGDSIVVTAGTPFHRTGSTNTMRVERL